MPALAPPPVPKCEVPHPEVCGWCHGAAVEPDEESGEIPCLQCDGQGYPTVEFDLPRSRSHKRRRARFQPGPWLLTITQGRQAKDYELWEFQPGKGWEGRAFYMVDAPTPDEHAAKGGERRDIFLGTKWHTCSCQGMEMLACAKANQRAWENGEAVFMSHGCKHLDALLPLLEAGWLDLKN